MKTFIDNAGRTWSISVNVSSVKRVKDMLQVNLLEIVNGELITRLYEDPELLCNVIYVLCRPQAEAQNITDEQFGESMGGDAIDNATAALLEDLVDFFPQARRTTLRKAQEKYQQMQQKAIEMVNAYLDDPQTMSVMESRVKSKLSNIIDSVGN